MLPFRKCLPACEIRMESGTDLKQAGSSPAQPHVPEGWIGNVGKNFQPSVFTRAVCIHDADNLARLYVKADIVQPPNPLWPSLCALGSTAHSESSSAAHES